MVGERNEAFLIRVWKLLYKQTHFKTVRLTAIRNEPKRTISANSELELLQIVLEPVTRSEDAGSSRRVDCEIPHRLGEGNEAFLMKVSKPLPSICDLKP